MKKMPGKTIPLKRSEDYYLKILLKETKLKDIMTKNVISVRVNTPFADIPKILGDQRIRHLPVVNQENQLIGLITQRDLFKIQPPKKLIDGQWYYDKEDLADVVLERVMIRDVAVMNLDDSMGDALVNMVQNKFGCIPVVDQHKVLKGIITQYDILSVAAQIYLE
jgi:CBS domain-containing protein